MTTPGDKFRELVDPIPSQVRSRSIRNGAILIVVAVLVVISAVTHNIPFINSDPGYSVEADFRTVNQVNDRTPVRVDGVVVGIVKGVEPGSDAAAGSRMTMQITDEDLVLRSDARATIRWRTLLGGSMYVDLEPGSPGAEELGDEVIPVSQTTTQVELDDVLRPYDGGTEQAQRDLLEGLSATFAEPEAATAAIDELPALESVRRGLEPLRGTESGDLRKMVAATARTVEALGTDVGELQTLVSSANRTFAALNARRAELGEFIELSPPTLDETEATMVRLRTTLEHLDPLVDNLRPGARELAPAVATAQPALDELKALLSEAQPLLRDARPTFDDLAAASIPGVPFLEGLEPTVDRLNAEILPYLNERDESTELLNYQAIGPFFSVLDSGAGGYDREGYRLRLSTPTGTNSFPLPGGGTGTPAAAQADLLGTCTDPLTRRCASFSHAFTEDLMTLARGNP